MNIIQIYKQFPTHKDCINHLEGVRWKGSPICPYCKSTSITPMRKQLRHHCNSCNTSFSVTVGTIFHNTKLDLQKWFFAISLILNAKKGLSARQIARDIEVNKNTAWYMGMRIRRAMADDGKLLQGIVEMDETYIGGKPRKRADKTSKETTKRGRGTKKTSVVGMMQRRGNVKAKVQKVLNSKNLSKLIRRNIKCDKSILMTDEYRAYIPIGKIVSHKFVNHQIEYTNGEIHTNNIEGFWSLVKRGIIGQYHKVSIKWLQKYIDEFSYRFNHRENEHIFDLTIYRALGIR